MVSTRSQTGSKSLKTKASHPASEDSTSRVRKRAKTTPVRIPTPVDLEERSESNLAARRQNANIHPLELHRGDRRKSILTGKTPTKAELRASEAANGPLKSATEKKAEIKAKEREDKGKGIVRDTVLDTVDLASPSAMKVPMTPVLQPGVLPTSQQYQDDLSGGNTFFPSVIWGAKEEVGLSRVGRAEREVSMWEESMRQHEEKAPHLVRAVRKQLTRAREARATIDDSLEENTRIGKPNPGEIAIKARLEALEWGLSTAEFGPEKDNIKCAMEGYKNGQITYSDHYTIIYAGHIVDTAKGYREFAKDRMVRLDRYGEIHGEGWLWYEPPLNIDPDSQPKALKSVGLLRGETYTNLGGYHVTQGFWKRSGYVSRVFSNNDDSSAVGFEQYFLQSADTPPKWWCQEDGPRVAYRTLLDSGATYTSLHKEDIERLGIDRARYGAQSMTTLLTANGLVNQRVYEVWMSVLDDNGLQLVEEMDPVYPRSYKFVGGICPVTESNSPLSYDEQGREMNVRLSGIIPFTCCYVSSTPTRSILWLGEDRNDVLGSHRIPGQKKWSIEMPTIPHALPMNLYDNPKIRFVHRGGQIIDEDNPYRRHHSRLLFAGNTPNQAVIDSDPWAAQNVRAPAPGYPDPEGNKLSIPEGGLDLDVRGLFQWEDANDLGLVMPTHVQQAALQAKLNEEAANPGERG